MTEVVTFTDLVDLRSYTNEDGSHFWRVDPAEDDEFKYFEVDDWELKLTFTKIFNPKIRDQVKYKHNATVFNVVGRHENTLWVKNATGYLTVSMSQVEPWSE